MNVFTRKTLGGQETKLDSQVMRPNGSPFSGLDAAGETADFGGGVHGHCALEGTFSPKPHLVRPDYRLGPIGRARLSRETESASPQLAGCTSCALGLARQIKSDSTDDPRNRDSLFVAPPNN